MNWPHDQNLLLMLTFLVAVFAIFVWFASQLLRGFKRERGAITQALEKSRELLETGKITSREFETIKRGLENS
jgi:uncharacterized membrane protein